MLEAVGRARAEQRSILSLGHEAALEQPPQPARRVQRREGVVDACPPESRGEGAVQAHLRLVHGQQHACALSSITAPRFLPAYQGAVPCSRRRATPPDGLPASPGRLATRCYGVTAVLVPLRCLSARQFEPGGVQQRVGEARVPRRLLEELTRLCREVSIGRAQAVRGQQHVELLHLGER